MTAVEELAIEPSGIMSKKAAEGSTFCSVLQRLVCFSETKKARNCEPSCLSAIKLASTFR